MAVNRRNFLIGGACAGGVSVLGGIFAYVDRLVAGAHERALRAERGRGGYGPLTPTRAENLDSVYLELPEGFHYSVFPVPGEPMSDGIARPRLADGMAAFGVGSEWRLVRNHEINNGTGVNGASLALAGLSYDGRAAGGTTTIVVDPHTRTPVRDFVSLSGTLQNCCGGPTPWGSWISCEETVLGPGRNMDGSGGFEQNHGYCFEVDAASDAPVTPVPLRAMGRFVHEAVAVDKKTGIVYETEDRLTAGFYRFLPNVRRDLAAGGQLQMLALRNAPGADLRTGQEVGAVYETEWVAIDDPDPVDAETDSLAVYRQGLAKGGATFGRLEGCFTVGRTVYVVSTNGGDAGVGQIWRYTHTLSGGRIELLFESPSPDLLDMPDNLTVSRRGGVLVCEDGTNGNFLRGFTRTGQVFDFAHNVVPGHESSEFAGACWSPDARTLFVNVQNPGYTFAIWGPWKTGAL